ncbi:MAG: bifunctional aldolase/short-chain dehydrogenase [Gammaproteobacteria bacterium]|nr:bifunctional aldolase/short-chain dehydrogenase [Gammaproteobacteria bacterium]
MKSLWNDNDTKSLSDELDFRVYTSRLLGRDKTLVLHGGGNTSVKITEKDIFGKDETRLYIKGSGWDLETIERDGFSPVRLEPLLNLAKLEKLSDPQMVNELRTNTVVATAPSPSVETILHALIPFSFVDHTHADALVTITNTPSGEKFIHEVYGDSVIVVPYVMPGFDLARVCAEYLAKYLKQETSGMVLMNHGLFSFGNSARESYERMIDLVTRAEEFLKARGAWKIEESIPDYDSSEIKAALSQLRRDISEVTGSPVIVTNSRDISALVFARRSDIHQVSQQGPATPDHVIRTKRVPMLGRDIKCYAKDYRDYFATYAPQANETKTMLDPAPRVILDPELGMCSVGRNAKDALVVQDLYEHTIDIISRASLLEEYRALPAKDIFDMEYWDLEQAKLKKTGGSPAFTGEIAWVTGAASGIGKACVESFLKRGAAVVGIDINPSIAGLFKQAGFLGIECDVTDGLALSRAVELAVRRFGGLDMLVLNAGVFPQAKSIGEMDLDEWHKVFDINLTANLTLMKLSYPLLMLSPQGGRVVIIGSKNVPAPGPGAAAYSASKAALNQLMRVAALEWGASRIRINTIHPNAVFDTALWTREVMESRAKSYGITVEEYKKRNIMETEVTSRDVAELAAEMCGPLFAKTTAAQVPVDGGDIRVI